MKYTVHTWFIPFFLFIGLLIGCQKDIRDDVDELLERVSKLEKMCEDANADIKDLKQIVTLLEANDYITSVNELFDKSGYTINFLKGNAIMIKHGTNGSYPVIGVEEFENVFYWTQKIGDNPSAWILDSAGNKIRATGVNGTTPVIGINKKGFWTVDYGEGTKELTVNGKPVSAKGKDGVDGIDGYSPFESITDKGDYIEIKLTTGGILNLHKWETKRMKVVFDVNEDNLITDEMFFNMESTVTYRVENPDPLASIYFEATNGWVVGHEPDNKSITIYSFGAFIREGCIIASVVKGDKLISQSVYSVKVKFISLEEEFIKAEPQPLEAIGGKVPVTINVTFPAKWFYKEAVIEVTPVLRYNGSKSWGTSYTFQGENVIGNNQVILYKEGANATMKSSFTYEPEMVKSELYLTFKVTIQGKEYTLPDIEIGEGVISTT